MSAGLASSAGIATVQQPRRGGRLLLTAAPGGGDVQPALAAARLVQHPALLGHFASGQLSSGSGDSQLSGSGKGGSSSSGAESGGLGRYLAHAPLAAATVLQGAEGLRPAHPAAGFALDRPLLLVATRAAVLFAGGGLEAVLVLPLDATGGLQGRKKKERRGGSSKHPSCALSCAAEPASNQLVANIHIVHCPRWLLHPSPLQRWRRGTAARRCRCSRGERRRRGAPTRQAPPPCAAA